MSARPFAPAILAAAERRYMGKPIASRAGAAEIEVQHHADSAAPAIHHPIWQPKPCPFCGDQANVVLEIDFGDVFRPRTVYAVCRNGHRTKGHPYERTSPTSHAAAEKAARKDWDTRA